MRSSPTWVNTARRSRKTTRTTLRRLLDEGRLRKEEVDGKGANVPDPN